MTLRELVEGMVKDHSWGMKEQAGGFDLLLPQEGGRSQVVNVSEFADDSSGMVRYTSQIGSVEGIGTNRFRAALELNAQLPHGCLAVDNGHMVITETRPLKTTTPQSSGEAVRFIARQADRYEKLIFGTDTH